MQLASERCCSTFVETLWRQTFWRQGKTLQHRVRKDGPGLLPGSVGRDHPDAREAVGALKWGGAAPVVAHGKGEKTVANLVKAVIATITQAGADLMIFAFVQSSDVIFQAECASNVNIRVHRELAKASIKLARQNAVLTALTS